MSFRQIYACPRARQVVWSYDGGYEAKWDSSGTEFKRNSDGGVKLSISPRHHRTALLRFWIEMVALDPGADAAKLERIVAMYERVKAKEAELAFNAAKGRILKKPAGIKLVKNRLALYEIDKGKPQKGTYEPSNTPRWRRDRQTSASAHVTSRAPEACRNRGS